jgi:prepilin-type N-terminal cleavage/methylation domain-containing protein
MSMAFNPKPVFLGETAGFSVKREKPSGTGVSSGIWAMKDSDPDPLSRDRLFQNFLAGENPRFFCCGMAFLPDRVRPGFSARGFTLVELLVVIAVIGVLASLALAVLPGMLENGRRVQCQSRLANLGRAVLLYAQDNEMTLPRTAAGANPTDPFATAAATYTADILPYLNLTKEQAQADRNLFRCPSRPNLPTSGTFERPQYAFNGVFPAPQGLARVRLHAIEKPSRTVLMAEGAVAHPFSNHPFRGMKVVPDAKCWIFFVDGHTAYLPIYSPGGGMTLASDPPASYGYQWSPGTGPEP